VKASPGRVKASAPSEPAPQGSRACEPGPSRSRRLRPPRLARALPRGSGIALPSAPDLGAGAIATRPRGATPAPTPRGTCPPRLLSGPCHASGALPFGRDPRTERSRELCRQPRDACDLQGQRAPGRYRLVPRQGVKDRQPARIGILEVALQRKLQMSYT